MTLAQADTFGATRHVDVSLRLLASAARPLKNRARVHFHSYTMETVGEIAIHSSGSNDPILAAKNAARMGQPQHPRSLLPGGEALAQIKLAEGALLLPGDRFIIRQFSPVVTIGGGVVLDAAPIPGFKRVAVDGLLQAAAAADSEEMLARRIARRRYRGLTVAQAISETGWRTEVIESHLAGPLAKGTVLRFGDLFFDSASMSALSILLPQSLAAFQKENPLVPGMGKETLREKFTLSPEVFAAVLGSLLREKKIDLAGDLVRLPGHGVVMKDEESESKKTIEAAFATAGLKVPALSEVIAGLKVDKARAQKIVTLLLREKVLIKISDELVFHRGALEELRRQMAAFKLKSTKIDVGKFKEMTGVSRKYAIPLLEYLDRERVTRRVGDAREIL
jgi:selenocysteine-specific elongation factor